MSKDRHMYLALWVDFSVQESAAVPSPPSKGQTPYIDKTTNHGQEPRLGSYIWVSHNGRNLNVGLKGGPGKTKNTDKRRIQTIEDPVKKRTPARGGYNQEVDISKRRKRARRGNEQDEDNIKKRTPARRGDHQEEHTRIKSTQARGQYNK